MQIDYESQKLATIVSGVINPATGQRRAVTVYHPDTAFGSASVRPTAQINWPALGSVSAEEAANFALLLTAAVEVAHALDKA